MQKQELTPLAFTKEQIAVKLNVCTRTVEREIQNENLKAVKIGRSVRVYESDFDAYLTSKSSKNGH